MARKYILSVLLSMWLLSCTNFDDHLFKVDKKAESINGIQLAVSLTGDDFIQCKGVVKYGDVILQHFDIVSNSEENPSELKINYSKFSQTTRKLAVDFVLKRKPVLEIFIQNKENEFYRKVYVPMNPKIPPVMTGIELTSNEITKKYPVGFKSEVYDMESFLEKRNINISNYTLERIATISLLIKNNTNMLQAVVPAGEDIPIYRALKNLAASVYCDSASLHPRLLLYPSSHNKYYNGPNFYNLVKNNYLNKIQTSTVTTLQSNNCLVKRNFNIEGLIGEYDLFLTISDGKDSYFFYDLGTLIFDNVAPEFSDLVLGNYYFGGNELFEGKVYLDYSIPVKQNPYNVIFSGKVFGDVKDIRVDGERVSFVKDGDLLFSKKIYIPDGYKDIDVKLSDAVGNIKNYTIPLIVSP